MIFTRHAGMALGQSQDARADLAVGWPPIIAKIMPHPARREATLGEGEVLAAVAYALEAEAPGGLPTVTA